MKWADNGPLGPGTLRTTPLFALFTLPTGGGRAALAPRDTTSEAQTDAKKWAAAVIYAGGAFEEQGASGDRTCHAKLE